MWGVTDPVLILMNCLKTHWGYPNNIKHVWYLQFKSGWLHWGACQLVIGGSLVQTSAELHVKVSLSKTLNPKLLLMRGWHLAWWPLPSLRALQWAGNLCRECPALAQRQPISSSIYPHYDPIIRDKAITDYRVQSTEYYRVLSESDHNNQWERHSGAGYAAAKKQLTF